MASFDRLSRRSFLAHAAAAAAGGVLTRQAAAAPAAAGDGGNRKGRWQIGCYTRPWDKHDVGTALDEIAKAGYKFAGLMTTRSKTNLVISAATTIDEARRVGGECKKRGLKVPSVYGGGIAVAKSLQAGIDSLKRLIDNCAAAGAANLLMGGVGSKKLYEPYYKAIAECCGYAAAKGVGISVKPHGGLNATGPQCRKTIERVAHKNFRIWYDPGNILYYSDGKVDPVADAATVDGLVVGMCMKDYRHPRNVMVTPGAGVVDFAKVLARLTRGGFAVGALMVETLARGDLAATRAEAVKARRFIEQLTEQKA